MHLFFNLLAFSNNCSSTLYTGYVPCLLSSFIKLALHKKKDLKKSMTAILDIISNFRLQQIATGCNFRLQQIAVSGCNSLQFQVAIQACNSLQLQVTTACNRLQHVAISGCNMLQFQVATDCNTLQFQVATDYNRLQFQINFKLQFQVAVQVSVLGCNFRLQFQISGFNFSFRNQ